jgi:hypothetical protein
MPTKTLVILRRALKRVSKGALHLGKQSAIGALFGLAVGSAVSAASACTLATAPTTRWSVESQNGIAWLRTPCGDRFYSLGVNALDSGYPWREHDGKVWYSWTAFAPTLAEWVRATQRRLAQWGFNTAGGWSLPPQTLPMPSVINLELGRNAKFHWFDPFDPDTETRMMAAARTLTAPYRNSPYRIGYFSDNEVGWWAGALFVFYSQKPETNFTKQRWVAMLREHYGDDWQRFAADFQPPAGVSSWQQLLAATAPTHMNPGGHGIAAVREWCGIVAERYYALSEKAIHAADPNALYFGDRLPIYYDPAAVRAEARHVDVIATNYNPDAGDGWIAHYFFDGLAKLSGGKPVLVTEWFFAATENRTGNRNNGHLMTVATQTERARGAAAADLNFAAFPGIVGTHWFQYYDHPKGGRPDGEDYDFGLVDINDRPYERLTAALADANRRVPQIHAAASAGPPSSDGEELPHAAISLAEHSLADWPKPASLLPPLVPSPGAVDFGEIYLSWSANGLNLATIGQDYYDIDLFAYDGAFPLGDAYRVEIGVDAGAGPKRYTLFFIPPRSHDPVHHDWQHMEAELCAGSAAEVSVRGCTAPPGAEAVYFGADQPRITAEMTLPWSLLGISPPAPGAAIHAEVAMTSFHDERWMSISGRPPDQDLADPAGWHLFRLGDGISSGTPAHSGSPG